MCPKPRNLCHNSLDNESSNTNFNNISNGAYLRRKYGRVRKIFKTTTKNTYIQYIFLVGLGHGTAYQVFVRKFKRKTKQAHLLNGEVR